MNKFFAERQQRRRWRRRDDALIHVPLNSGQSFTCGPKFQAKLRKKGYRLLSLGLAGAAVAVYVCLSVCVCCWEKRRHKAQNIIISVLMSWLNGILDVLEHNGIKMRLYITLWLLLTRVCTLKHTNN